MPRKKMDDLLFERERTIFSTSVRKYGFSSATIAKYPVAAVTVIALAFCTYPNI